MEAQVATTNPSASPVADRAARSPRVDIFENETEILLLADVPGATPDGVTVEVERGTLRLRADAGPDAPLGASHWARTFLVPRGVEAGEIRAELKHGVLRVVLPKSPQLRRRQVEVKAG